VNQAILVFAVLGVTIALFASDRFRLDLVALLSMLTLAILGVLTPAQALAGFAEPLTLMIAGLFVVGAGLFETGVADRLGDVLARIAGREPTRLLIATMLIAALLSAFLSSTGTVAVLLPVVVGLARGAGLSPSRLLMPLAFGSLLGGMLTLIGTPPNLVVADQLRAMGERPFGFFAFTPVGLTMLAVGVLYMATIGRRLLPDHDDTTRGAAPTLDQLAARYGVDARLHEAEVPYGSPLVGTTVAASDLRGRFRVTILAVETPGGDGPHVRRAEPGTLIRAHDVLHLLAEPDDLDRFLSETGSILDDEPRMPIPEPLMLIETLLPPDSAYEGKRLDESRLHDRTRATVLAVRRGGQLFHGEALRTRELEVGDALLLAGGPVAQRRVAAARSDLVVVNAPREWERFARDTRRAPAAVAILAALLVTMTAGLLPNAIAVLAAAVAMVVTGAVSMERAYEAINWESVVLIAAILPMATALEVSGGLDAVVGGLVGALGTAGPLLVMAALFVLTSAFSQVISNTATTVLIAPVAFAAAVDLGVSPEAMLMAVAVAASTAFATPVASPVNALVLTSGRYRFTDFLKVGLPIVVLMLIATLLVVPLVFPLSAG
jgi:di/tricarboxylate transporter